MSTTAITPTTLLAAIPALLGFIPRESLIVIGTSHNKVSVSVRADLADGTAPIAAILNALRATSTDAVRLVVVTTQDHPSHAHPALAHTSILMAPSGIPIVAQVQTNTVAVPGAPWVDHTTGTSGHTTDYRDSAVTATVVSEGRTIDPDRTDVEARFTRTTRQVTAADPHTVDAAATVRRIIAAMRDRRTLTEALAADIAGVISQGKDKRDALLRTVIYDQVAAADVFTRCANMLTGRARADVLTLAAVGYYYAGQGTCVNAAIIAARTETAQVDSLLMLIERAILRGVHPADIRDALSDLTSHDRASELLGSEYPPYE